MSATTTRTAIITGGCSGIGLSVVHSLLSKSSPRWRVVLADINASAWDKIKSDLDSERTTFFDTDVADWDSQASMFERAYEWSGQRIDFFHANAGIADREAVWQPFDLDTPPQKPNLDCLDVNIIAVFYGMKLFTHYARKTRRGLSQDGQFHPKMVITASCAGQYPFLLAPQYAAAKAGCVNLARSAAPALSKHDDIGLNCIMPAFLATNIIAKELIDQWPKEYITPTSTACRAIDELISETGEVEQDGKSDGKQGEVKIGQSVEVSLDRLYYRTPKSYPDNAQEFVINSTKEGGLWERVYAELIQKGMKGVDAGQSDPRTEGNI